MPYKFDYAVKDEYSYNDYAHQQESDGKVVTGSYRVLLPDGRTQVRFNQFNKDNRFTALCINIKAIIPGINIL
jgi:hypothetical protein